MKSMLSNCLTTTLASVCMYEVRRASRSRDSDVFSHVICSPNFFLICYQTNFFYYLPTSKHRGKISSIMKMRYSTLIRLN